MNRFGDNWLDDYDSKIRSNSFESKNGQKRNKQSENRIKHFFQEEELYANNNKGKEKKQKNQNNEWKNQTIIESIYNTYKNKVVENDNLNLQNYNSTNRIANNLNINEQNSNKYNEDEEFYESFDYKRELRSEKYQKTNIENNISNRRYIDKNEKRETDRHNYHNENYLNGNKNNIQRFPSQEDEIVNNYNSKYNYYNNENYYDNKWDNGEKQYKNQTNRRDSRNYDYPSLNVNQDQNLSNKNIDFNDRYYDNMDREKKQSIWRRMGVFSTILVILAIVFLLSSFVFAYNSVKGNSFALAKKEDIKLDKSKIIEIEIPRNASVGKVAEILKEKEIIKFPFLYKMLSKYNGKDAENKKGIHFVTKDLTYNELLAIMTSPADKTSERKVTITEGMFAGQIFKKLEEVGLLSKEEEEKYSKIEFYENEFPFLKNKSRDNLKNSLEGYLFPETYKFDPDSDKSEYIRTMLKQFQKKLPEDYEKKASGLGLKLDQVITIASLVEKESGKNDDWAKIASVIYNRATNTKPTENRPNLLQMDSAINYILFHKNGQIKDSYKMTVDDLKISDKFNTHNNTGLPPGPICNPGEKAILAALNPTKTEYYFFVAKSDGSQSSYFASSYAEHNKNLAQADKNKKK